MPLILDRKEVLDIYSRAGKKNWTIPSFCSENLTTTEAILSGTLEFGLKKGIKDLPVTIAITNNYSHRSQSSNYTHTRKWDLGLNLFLSDIQILTAKGSPFENLNVMLLLDHTQWDTDSDLLNWDMDLFSMIMFDASSLPFDENIKLTKEFVRDKGDEIVIEGACDEIIEAGGEKSVKLTSPQSAKHFIETTGVDYIVVNLGTEHRATGSDLKYHGELARKISKLTGPKLVLHGTSSVKEDQLINLFNDGIAKVNIWTGLERDSSPVLFEEMLKNVNSIISKQKVKELKTEGLLGENVLENGIPSIDYFTTLFRQDIIFQKMKEIVLNYLGIWYR